MTKRKSIVCLTIAVLLVLFLAAFCFWPKFEIGIVDYIAPVYNIKLGLDLKGGVYVTFEVETIDDDGTDLLSTEEGKALLKSRIDGTAKVMQDRLGQKGYTEAVVTPIVSDNSYRIKVEIPNIESQEDVFDIIGKPAELFIRMGDQESGDKAFEAKDIVSATAYYDQETSGYAVQLELNDMAQSALSEATANCATTSSTIYFVLDGTVISQPTVSSQITGKYSKITGFSDYDTANNIAIQISSGSYELSFKNNVDEMRTIGATLGEQAITTTIIAGLIGLVVIMVFLIAVYGFMGVAAALSLVYYVILMVLALAFMPFAQLTLPGIAGIILSIGMAVDASIIIFERIKEEYRSGKSRENSIQLGLRRSLSAIIDGNVTTFLGGLILYIFASSAIMGFAVTLMFGIAISMLTTFLFMRLFLKWLSPLSQNDKLFALKVKTPAVGRGGEKA